MKSFEFSCHATLLIGALGLLGLVNGTTGVSIRPMGIINDPITDPPTGPGDPGSGQRVEYCRDIYLACSSKATTMEQLNNCEIDFTNCCNRF